MIDMCSHHWRIREELETGLKSTWILDAGIQKWDSVCGPLSCSSASKTNITCTGLYDVLTYEYFKHDFQLDVHYDTLRGGFIISVKLNLIWYVILF